MGRFRWKSRNLGSNRSKAQILDAGRPLELAPKAVETILAPDGVDCARDCGLNVYKRAWIRTRVNLASVLRIEIRPQLRRDAGRRQERVHLAPRDLVAHLRRWPAVT